MGLLKDPILNFHFEEGAKIISAVKNYRPKDLDNFGNGVHIRYSFGDWLSKKQQV